MTWHIDNANFFAIGKREPAKAKLNGHLAQLFFFETIRMSTGQRCNERRLAMIYMTCCSDNAHELTSFVFPLLGFKEERGKIILSRIFYFFVVFFFVVLPCPIIRSYA